jgi:hypothetical protein
MNTRARSTEKVLAWRLEFELPAGPRALTGGLANARFISNRRTPALSSGLRRRA